MGSAEEVLVAALRADGPVAARIGTRIFPDERPSGAVGRLPAVVYSINDGRTITTNDGPTALAERVVEFDCQARTATEAATLAEEVKAVVNGYAGEADGYRVQGAFHDSTVDQFDAPQDGSDEGVHRRAVEFNVWGEIT